MASARRLVEARVELEHLVVELGARVGVADLARGDDGGGVQVLRLLLRVVDELGELEDDLDQLGPVLLLAVELHQLGEDLAVVGALVERGDVALGGARAVVELASPAMSPISSRSVARARRRVATSSRRVLMRTTSSQSFLAS